MHPSLWMYAYADLNEFRQILEPFLNDENLKKLIIWEQGGLIKQ